MILQNSRTKGTFFNFQDQGQIQGLFQVCGNPDKQTLSGKDLNKMFTSLEIILAVGTSQTSDREIKSPNEDILSAPEEEERKPMRQRSS